MFRNLRRFVSGFPGAPACIAAGALLATLPLWSYGPSCGHDFDFHLQSWFAANADWRSGLYAPHWLPGANYGAGEPRFVFYPPLSWVLGGLLGLILPWTLVPQTFTFLALTASGAAFYTLARAWVRPGLAAAAACLYLANPYMLFVAYERTAYGELLGASLMPLIVLYGLRERPPVVPLALTVAALWLTNAPSAVMGCYLLGLCAVVAAVGARRLQPAVRSTTALVLGSGAAGFYLLPAWYEQRWVEIARATGPGMRIEDSFLFGHTGEPFHDQVLHTASWIGVAILGVGLAAALEQFSYCCRAPGSSQRGFSLRKSHTGSGRSHYTYRKTALILRLALPQASAGTVAESLDQAAAVARVRALLLPALAAGLVAILLLQLRFSEPLWRLAPELRFLQFPWRWLLVAGLLATLALVAAADQLLRRLSRRRLGRSMLPAGAALVLISACGALFLWGAGAFAGHRFAQYCDEEDNVLAQEKLVQEKLVQEKVVQKKLSAPGSAPAYAPDGARPGQATGKTSGDSPGFPGTDEYTPSGADNDAIQQGLPPVRLLGSASDDEGDDSSVPNPGWQPAPTRPTPDPERTQLRGRVHIDQWEPEHKRLTLTADAPGFAVLRLMDYPAWQVEENGRVIKDRPHREDGLLAVRIPAGTSTLSIRYRATPDVWAGRTLSLLCLATLMIRASRPRWPGWFEPRKPEDRPGAGTLRLK